MISGRSIRRAWFTVIAAASWAHAVPPSLTTAILGDVMRPGMTIHGMMVPLDPLAGSAAGLIRADHATVGRAPGVFLLDGLRYTAAAPAFSLAAPRAGYETGTGRIHAPSGFTADGETLRIRGDSLAGEVRTRRFDLTGFVEIGIKPRFVPSVALAAGRILSADPWRITPVTPFPCILPPDASGFIARFAGRMDRYMRCLAAEDALACPRTIILVGREGGRLDLPDRRLSITGPAAILGQGMMLACDGGIRIAEEEEGFRALASGSVEAWIHATKRNSVTTIQCASFESAGAGEVVQFQGGPLVARKHGMTLSATESWQFLRVFEGGRIVLGPGAWEMEGGALPPG